MATIDYILMEDGSPMLMEDGDLALYESSAELPNLYPGRPVDFEVTRARKEHTISNIDATTDEVRLDSSEGDVTQYYVAGARFEVTGNGTHDGVYTIKSVNYNTVTDQTRITVETDISTDNPGGTSTAPPHITLSWTAPNDANDDTVYLIRRADDLARKKFTDVQTIQHATTTWTDYGLDFETNYKYALFGRHQIDDYTDKETQGPESESKFTTGQNQTL